MCAADPGPLGRVDGGGEAGGRHQGGQGEGHVGPGVARLRDAARELELETLSV